MYLNTAFDQLVTSQQLPELIEYLDIICKLEHVETNNYSLDRNIEEVTSGERLECLKSTYGDVVFPIDLPDNDNRYLGTYFPNQHLETYVSNTFGFVARNSGYFWYPYRGYSGWHTNSDIGGERVYFVWAQEDNKSFFRYQDPESGDIITQWDKAGWQINRFCIPQKGRLWHCIGSYTNRVSIGFRPLHHADLVEDECEYDTLSLSGIHTCFVSEKWNVFPNKNSFIDLANLEEFLDGKEPVAIPHEKIAWKAQHDPQKAVDAQYRKCDISFPGIVAQGVTNPYDLPYRMVDGQRRLAKMTLETNIKTSPYYILSSDEFYAAMTMGNPANASPIAQ